mmetsp:Transcript_2513/g.4267  ORF Transcript_2513/g.4267 Transcript_2513/m.4267 type:complete len:224 (+) Transcript_2513:159-830(+)
MEASFSMVRPMSSRPFSRQCFLNASTSNLITSPSEVVISCASRSTVMRAFSPFSASAISTSTCSCGSTIGSMPFLKLLLKKMSAKDVDTITLMPKSSSAQGACSREEPQPKLSPAIRICALRYCGLFSTKSGISVPSRLNRISSNRLAPKPVRAMDFKNTFGMIMSVSIFTSGIGAAIPEKVSNFSIVLLQCAQGATKSRCSGLWIRPRPHILSLRDLTKQLV